MHVETVITLATIFRNRVEAIRENKHLSEKEQRKFINQAHEELRITLRRNYQSPTVQNKKGLE